MGDKVYEEIYCIIILLMLSKIEEAQTGEEIDKKNQ